MADAGEGVRRIISANDIVKDGATVLLGGNVDSSNTVTNTASSVLGAPKNTKDNRIQLAQPMAAGSLVGHAQRALSGNIFNDQRKGQYIGELMGTGVAGVGNNVLQTTAGDFGQRKGVNFIESIITTRFSLIGRSYETGKLLTKIVDDSDQVLHGSDDFSTDEAARRPKKTSSGFIPGALAFMEGSVIPTSGEYQKLTTL